MKRTWTKTRSRLAARSLALLALAGAAGCGQSPFELTLATLEDHRARWLASGIQDYQYAYSVSCECSPGLTRPTVIEVRQGAVTSVVYTDTGLPPESSLQDVFPTIDELFDVIDEAIRREAASLVVSYDAVLGYPTNISIDYDMRVVDDEISMVASDLTAL